MPDYSTALRYRFGVITAGLLSLSAASAVRAGEETFGFFKLPLGTFTVVALYDGNFTLPASTLMMDAHQGEVREALSSAHLGNDVATTVNAYLIDTGSKRILIDTGSGEFLGRTLGKVNANLRTAGYRPEQIDEVLITHLHPDHVGGLVDHGRMVYSRAIVRVDAREQAFWENRENLGKVDAYVKGTFDAVAAALSPYVRAGRVRSFKHGETVAPGITAIPEPGHTAGHTGYRVVSHGKVLMVWGDLIHLSAAQFADPKVAIRVDSTPALAIATREKALDVASRSGDLAAGAHIPFPGIGTVKRLGNGYAWTPVGQ